MDKKRALLQFLQARGQYTDVSFEDFSADLDNPEWASALHAGMKADKILGGDLDSYDNFATALGIKKKTQPGAGSGVGSQEVSLTPPQVEAPAPPSPQAPGPQPATTPPMGVPTQEQVSREQLARQRQIAEQTPLVLSPERYKQAEQERAQPAELGQIEQDFPVKSPQSGVADLQRARSERMTGVQRPAPATPTVEMTGTAYKTKTEKRPVFGPSGDIIRFDEVPVGPVVDRERTLNSGLKLSEAYTLLKLRGEIPKETKIGEFVSQYAGNTNRLTELDTRISGIQQEKEQEKQAEATRIQEEYTSGVKLARQTIESKTGKAYTDEQVKKMLEEQFGIYEPGKEPVQQASEKPAAQIDNYSRWGILRGVRQGLRGFAAGMEARLIEASKVKELGNDLIEGIAVDFDGEVSRLQSLAQKGLVDPKAPKELFDKRVEALKEKYPGGLIFPEIQQEYKTAKMIERELSSEQRLAQLREKYKEAQSQLEFAGVESEDLLKQGRYVDFIVKSSGDAFASAPSFVMSMIPVVGPAMSGVATAKSKYDEIKEEYGDVMTAGGAINATITGSLDALGAKFTEGIGKAAFELATNVGTIAAKRTIGAVLNNIGFKMVGSAGQEFLEEGLVTLAENIVDKATINPNQNLSEGVLESAAAGGVLGPIPIALGGGIKLARFRGDQAAYRRQLLLNAIDVMTKSHQAFYDPKDVSTDTVNETVDAYLSDLAQSIVSRSKGKYDEKTVLQSPEYLAIANNREQIVNSISQAVGLAETFSQLSEAEQAFSSYLDTIESQGTKVRTDEDIQNALTNFYQANPDAAKEESRLLMVGRAFASQKQEQDATQKVENLQPQGGELQPVGTEEGQQVQGTGQEAQPGTDAGDLAAVGGMQAGQVTEQPPVDGAEQPPVDGAEQPTVAPAEGVTAQPTPEELAQIDRDLQEAFNQVYRTDKTALDEGFVEFAAQRDAMREAGGDSFFGHGMGKSSIVRAVSDLLGLFQNGIDPTRGGGQLYSAPMYSEPGAGAALGTAGGVYADGPFILGSSNPTIRNIADIEAIFVNDGLVAIRPDILDLLRKRFPNLVVETYSNAASGITQAKAKKQGAQRVQPTAAPAEGVTAQPEPTAVAPTEPAQTAPQPTAVAPEPTPVAAPMPFSWSKPSIEINQSTIYSPEPLPANKVFRSQKYSDSVKKKQTFYAITPDAANPNSASFDLVRDEETAGVAFNALSTFIQTAFDIQGDVRQGLSINAIERIIPGKLEKVGDNWRITQKGVIVLKGATQATAKPTTAPQPTAVAPTEPAPTAAPEPTGVTPTEPGVTPTAAPAAPAATDSPYAITGKRREVIRSPADRRKKIPIYDSAQTTVDELLNEFEKQDEKQWIDEKKFRQIHERVLTVSRVLSRFGIKIYFTAKMENSSNVVKGAYFNKKLGGGKQYIVISAKDATVSTVVHEAFHAIIRNGKLSSTQVVKDLYNPIMNILKNNPDTVATYNKIQDWLKGAKYRRDEVPEEFLAQLSGYISDGIGKKPLDKSVIAKLEKVINDVLEKLLGKDVLVVRFSDKTDVIDFFNTLTDGLTTGDTALVERALELYESGRVTNPRKTIYFKGTEIPNGRKFVENVLNALERIESESAKYPQGGVINELTIIDGIQRIINNTLKLIPGLEKTSITINTGKDARNLIVEMSDKNTIQGKKIGATAKKIQDAIADIVLAINDYLASRGNDPQLEEYKLDPIDGQDTVQSDINAEMMPEEVRNPDKTQFNKQQEMVKSIQEAISNLDRERQKIAFAIRNKAKFISDKTKANTVSSSMRVAGISPVVSELLTGITSDVVGNPRIAIGARTAKIKKIIARGESGPLSSFLSFPDMYDLIPQLADYTVQHDETVGDVQATIDLDAKTIRVGNMNVGNTEQDFFIALMNEVRYAAQDFELFEAGVTPEGSLDAQEMFAAMRTQINMRVKELQDRLNRDKKEGYSPAFIADSQAELNQAMEQAAKINAIGDRNSYFNYVRSIPTNSLTDINGRILTYSEIQNQIDANESRKQHYISLFNNITDEGQTITHVKSDEINLYAKQVDDGTHIIEVRVKNGNEGFYSPKSLQFKGIPTREEMFRKIGEILPTLKNILSRQYDKQIAFYKKAQLLAPGTTPSAQIIGSAGGFKSESDPEYWRYMYTRNSMPNSADFISMDIPGISNKYQPSDTHVFHGTNTYEINQNGDLVLKPSKNFEGKTVSISTTPIPVVAQDYMLRKQGNIIIKINRQALRGKGEVVSADEIAINTTEPFIIPSDQFEIINVKSLKDKKREEYDYTANSVSDKILSSESDIIALSKAFGSFINAQNEEEIELNERKSESGTKPAWYKSTVEIQELAGNKIYDRLKDKINKQFIIDGIAEEAIRQIEFKGPVLYAGNKKEDAVAEYLHDLDTYGDTSSPFASDLFSELLNVIGIYDAPIYPGEKQRDEYLAIVKAIIDKVESAGVTIAIKNELTYTYISPDDLASMDPSDRTNILADQMDFDGTTEEMLFEVADTEQFASQDSMVKSRKIFDQTKFISVANAMQRLATVNPDYLRPVLNSIREMRRRTRNGELQPSDVAKAWMMSVASQQAGPVDAATASKHLASKGINVVLDESVFAESYSVKDRKTKETVIKQGGIRPEAMAAMMLSSSMGRKFLSDLNKGQVDTGFIDKFIDAISLYGMQNKKRESIIGTGEKKGIYQLREVTSRLNEIGKKGPEANEEFYKELMTLGMIKEGKAGFMGQFLGISDRGVIDSRQLDFWIENGGDGEKKISDKASAELIARIGMVAKRLGFAEEDAYIAHHLIWDKVGGIEVVHQSMYELMMDYNLQDEQNMMFEMAENSVPDTLSSSIKSNPNFRPAVRLIDTYLNDDTSMTPYSTDHELARALIMQFGFSPYEARQLIEHRAGRRYRAAHPMTVDADASYEAMVHYFKQASVWSKEGREKWKQFAYSLDLWVGNYLTGVRTLMNQLTKQAGAGTTPSELNAYAALQNMRGKSAFRIMNYRDKFIGDPESVSSKRDSFIGRLSSALGKGATETFNKFMIAQHQEERYDRLIAKQLKKISEMMRVMTERDLEAQEKQDAINALSSIMAASSDPAAVEGQMKRLEAEIEKLSKKNESVRNILETQKEFLDQLEQRKMSAIEFREKVFDEMTPEQLTKAREFYAEFKRDYVDEFVNVLLDGGIISQERADYLLNGTTEDDPVGWQFYVPLLIEESAYADEYGEFQSPMDGAPNSKSYATIANPGIQRLRGAVAFGEQDIQNILHVVFDKLTRATVLAEQNLARQTMADMLQQYPSQTLYVDSKGNEHPRYQVISSRARPVVNEFGEVVGVDDYTPEVVKKQSIQFIDKDGKMKYIFFANANDPVLLGARAKPSEFSAMGKGIIKGLNILNNVFRPLITQFSPTFIIQNPFRDVQEALISIDTEGKQIRPTSRKLKRSLLKNYFKAIAFFAGNTWLAKAMGVDNKTSKSAWRRQMYDMWMEVQQEGGRMSWAMLGANPTESMESLQKSMLDAELAATANPSNEQVESWMQGVQSDIAAKQAEIDAIIVASTTTTTTAATTGTTTALSAEDKAKVAKLTAQKKALELKLKAVEKTVNTAGQVVYRVKNPKFLIKDAFLQLSKLSDFTENLSRLAAHTTVREAGGSPREGAMVARNITINFEKRGLADALRAGNAGWLFLNVGIQGARRFGKLLANPEGRKAMLTLIILSAANRALFHAFTDDEEEEYNKKKYIYSDYIGRNKTLVHNPFNPNAPIMIPKAYGLSRLAYTLGEGMVDMAYELKSPGDIAIDATMDILTAVDPIGGGSSAPVNYLPVAALSPLFQALFNQDYMGNEILRSYGFSSSLMPNYQKKYKTTEEWAVKFAEGMYNAVGFIDVSPVKIEFLAKEYGGLGPARFLQNINDMAKLAEENGEQLGIDKALLSTIKPLYREDISEKAAYDMYILLDVVRQSGARSAITGIPEGKKKFMKDALNHVRQNELMKPQQIVQMKKALRARYPDETEFIDGL